MKKLFRKSAMAITVAGVLALSGGVSADSLLAPLVIDDADGSTTYLQFKVRGDAAVNASGAASQIHYTWIQKGTNTDHLYDLDRTCNMVNNYGSMTAWDIMHQDTRGNGFVPGLTDGSTPNGFAGNFVGMLVVDDMANITPEGTKVNDGDMAGFVNIVDPSGAFVLDYKMLNNHKSTASGDFGAGFISKHAIDFMWGPTLLWDTSWLVAVTGADMTKHDPSMGYTSTYDAAVTISQATRGGEDSPTIPTGGSGFYDTDEMVTSGSAPITVTCMGIINHDGRSPNYPHPILGGNAPEAGLVGPGQYLAARDGGWTRRSIIPVAGTNHAASGAIVYKTEWAPLDPVAVPVTFRNPTFQIETGGHLSPGANHVNRPN